MTRHSRSTEGLPVEVLALIFQHAVTISPPQHHPTFTIAHVCSLWREVAWSTPPIWTVLQSGTITNRNAASFLQILHIHFSNVQNFPIFLEITYSEALASVEVTTIVNRTLLRKANAHKIQSLILNGTIAGKAPPEFTFANLEELDVDMGWKNTFNLTTLPNLKRLTIRRLNHLSKHNSGRIPFSNLTSLRLINVCPYICVHFLLQCHRLVEFVNHFDGLPLWSSIDVEPKVQPGNKIVLEDLEHFSWTYIPQSGSDILLSNLHFPSLKTLGWHQSRNFPPTDDLASFTKTFCSNISSSLTKIIFECHSLSWPLSIIKDILLRFPHVEEIILKNGSSSNIHLLLDTLMSTPDLKTSSGDNHFYLPSLQTLTFSNGFGLTNGSKHKPLKSIQDALLQSPIQSFLSSNRFNRPGISRFRIKLIDIDPYIPESSLLEEMCGRGFNLEIMRNGERLDRPGLWGRKPVMIS